MCDGRRAERQPARGQLVTAEYGLEEAVARVEPALSMLGDHLDDVGFVRFHQYLVTPGLFCVNPNLLRAYSTASAGALGRYTLGDTSNLRLALCLMVDVPTRYDELPASQQRLADALLEVNLLVRVGDDLRMAGLQLISFRGMPLFIDRRLNFGGPTHEVYIGPDTLLLTYYVDVEGLGPTDRVLDMGTGSGAMALYTSRYAGHGVATDVMPAPLWLTRVNRALNRRTVLEVRQETYLETLERGERYKVVTFNPPFLAFPEELDAPFFAKGPGHDGMDYCRMLIELFHHIVEPGGAAYIVADIPGGDRQPHFVGRPGAVCARPRPGDRGVHRGSDRLPRERQAASDLRPLHRTGEPRQRPRADLRPGPRAASK